MRVRRNKILAFDVLDLNVTGWPFLDRALSLRPLDGLMLDQLTTAIDPAITTDEVVDALAKKPLV
ncbi:MAG: hypothetical protein AAF219_04365 [Myxococcota bacterium]